MQKRSKELEFSRVAETKHGLAFRICWLGLLVDGAVFDFRMKW